MAASISTGFQLFPAACNCTHIANPAGGFYDSAPAWGCILQTFQNILTFFVGFAALAITVFIVLAAFTYMTSGGAPEKRQLANKRIMNAVIGLAIVLCAYLVVDSIMKVIYNPNNAQFGPWNSILAEGANQGTTCLALHNPPNALPTNTNAAAGGNATAAPAATQAPGNSGLNISAAISYLQSHAQPLNNYTGQCAVAIRNALNAGGLTAFSVGRGNAYQYGPLLTSAGFSSVYTGTYSSASQSAFAYQAGDVVVFQPVSGHPNGHITMYTGSQWISDAVQANMASNQSDYQGGSFTVYRP